MSRYSMSYVAIVHREQQHVSPSVERSQPTTRSLGIWQQASLTGDRPGYRVIQEHSCTALKLPHTDGTWGHFEVHNSGASGSRLLILAEVRLVHAA